MAKTQKNIWTPLRFFVGSWEGGSDKSRTERDYEFVLDGKFLRVRSKSTFEPTEKNPKGEIHEEVGYFSYDTNRKNFILREFHVEGFVNQYVLESFADNGRTMVFVAESIENISPGWRARETYKILSNDEFNDIFELAPPRKNFKIYVTNYLRRKPS